MVKKKKKETSKNGGDRDDHHASIEKCDPKEKAEDTFAYWDKAKMERAKPLSVDRQDDDE